MNYNSIALVDLSYLFRKRWHAQAADAEINEAASGVLRDLARVRESVDHVILCADSPPYFRSNIDPEYKANRPTVSDGIKSQMRWLKERVDADGYHVAKCPTFEADDVIATLSVQLSRECEDVRIVGSDKDLAQCVNERVRMFVPAVGERPEEVVGPPEVFRKFGVPPLAIVNLLALMGDTSDNVPGCPGIGLKTAAKMLDENQLSLDKLLENLKADAEAGAPLKAKERAVLEHEEQIFKSRELVRLRTDVPIEAAGYLKPKEPKPLVDTTDIDETHVEELIVTQAKPERPTQIVRHTHPAEWSLTLQPQTCAEAFKLAGVLVNSRLYSKFPTQEAVFAVLLRGRELGLGVTTALDNFHVIEGKPAASAHLIMALTQRHPDCEYLMMVESTGERAVYQTKHRRQPRPVRMEYTLKEAQDAGLIRSRGPWDKFPKAMLRKTCGVLLCRAVYQEATCGLYCIEEHGMEAEQ